MQTLERVNKVTNYKDLVLWIAHNVLGEPIGTPCTIKWYVTTQIRAKELADDFASSVCDPWKPLSPPSKVTGAFQVQKKLFSGAYYKYTNWIDELEKYFEIEIGILQDQREQRKYDMTNKHRVKNGYKIHGLRTANGLSSGNNNNRFYETYDEAYNQAKKYAMRGEDSIVIYKAMTIVELEQAPVRDCKALCLDDPDF